MEASDITKILRNSLPTFPINRPEDKNRLREKLAEIVELNMTSVYMLAPILIEALDYCGSSCYQDIKDILLLAREKMRWDDKADDFTFNIHSYCKNGWPQYEIFDKRLGKAQKYGNLTFTGVVLLYEKIK